MTHRTNRRPPEIHRWAFEQAHYLLTLEARRRGLNFGGRPTGVKQIGRKVFLYQDVGVGMVIARVVQEVPPLDIYNDELAPTPITVAPRRRRQTGG